MRTVFVSPLFGFEPLRSEVVYDGKSYMVVKHETGFEEVISKHHSERVISDSEEEYWVKMHKLELKVIENIRSSLFFHLASAENFEKLSKSVDKNGS